MKPRRVPRRARCAGINDGDVVGVDLRHHHGHVVGPAVGGVVGDHRHLGLGVGLLQGADLLLLHIHGAEAEIHHARQLLGISLGVQHHDLLGLLRHGDVQGPAVCHGLFIGLSGAAGAGGQGRQAEPGMVLHQGDEALAHHAGGADDAHVVLFHRIFLLLKLML